MGCLHGMSAIIETNKILRFPPILCCGQKNRGKNVAVDEVIKKSKRQKTNKKNPQEWELQNFTASRLQLQKFATQHQVKKSEELNYNLLPQS